MIRLYTRYLTDECGGVESDYVFINLFAEPVGRPMTYTGALDVFRQLEKEPEFAFIRINSGTRMPRK